MLERIGETSGTHGIYQFSSQDGQIPIHTSYISVNAIANVDVYMAGAVRGPVTTELAARAGETIVSQTTETLFNQKYGDEAILTNGSLTVTKVASNIRIQKIIAACHLLGIKSISFNFCENLVNVDLRQLKSLVKVNCCGCSALEYLNVGGMQNLKSLEISDCARLKNINLHKLSDLTKLSCVRCPRLEYLNFRGLINLINLNCSECDQLKDLNLSSFKNLQILHCSHTAISYLDITELKNLKEINCSYSNISKLIFNDETKIEVLDCSNTNIKSLDLHALSNLRTVICKQCYALKNLHINGLRILEEVDCSYSGKITSLHLEDLPSLSNLKCENCFLLKSLNIGNLPALKKLNFSVCSHLETVSFGELPSLEELIGEKCLKVTILDLRRLTNLSKGHFSLCQNLVSLNVNGLPNLTHLECERCSKLASLDLGNLPMLHQLLCSFCDNLTNLDVSGLTNIKQFIFFSLLNLRQINLGDLTALQHLVLTNCNKIENLNISGLTNLNRLELASLNIQNLIFTGLQNINHLYIENCARLTNLDLLPLTNLVNIRLVLLNNFQSLDIPSLNRLANISLNRLPKLRNMNFGELPNLANISLSYCTALNSNLDLSRCPSLRTITTNSPTMPMSAITLNQQSPYARNLRTMTEISQENILSGFRDIGASDEDCAVLSEILTGIRNHRISNQAQKNRALRIIANFCKNHTGHHLSLDEKTRFFSELREFSTTFKSCRDAFESGIVKLNISLNIKNYLREDKIANRNVLLKTYIAECVEKSLSKFAQKWNEQPEKSEYSTAEIVEIQSLINIVLEVPGVSSISHAEFAVRNAALLTKIIETRPIFEPDTKPGHDFLNEHPHIKKCFQAKLDKIFARNQQLKPLYESIRIPFELVVTTILHKKEEFLMFISDEEILPYVSIKPVSEYTICELPVAECIIKESIKKNAINYLSSTEIEVTKGKLKAFVSAHKDDIDWNCDLLTETPTLMQIFTIAFDIDKKTDEDNLIIKILGFILSLQNMQIIQSSKLAQDFNTDKKYRQAVAAALMSGIIRVAS